jgi:hypothetical protein
MMMMYDDDGCYDVWWWWSWLWPRWSLDDALGAMICVEPMFHVRDDSYLNNKDTWSLQQRHLICMSYLSRCISTSCVDSLGMTSPSINRSLGQLMEHHLHQLQPSSASTSASSFFSSQIPFAIDAKGGEMSLLRGAHPEGELVFSCHQWQRGRLLFSLSLAWFV